MECLLLLLTQQQPAGHRRLRTDRLRRTKGRRAHTAATFRNGSVAASFIYINPDPHHRIHPAGSSRKARQAKKHGRPCHARASDRAGVAVHPAEARHRSQAPPGACSAPPRKEHDLHPGIGFDGQKTVRRPVYRPQNDFRGAEGKPSGQPICAPYGRKKGGQRKTAARP